MTTQDGTEREGLDTAARPLNYANACALLRKSESQVAALLAALGRAEAEVSACTREVRNLEASEAASRRRLAAAEAVVEAAGELEFLDEPCSHLPLEMIDGVMEACDVCALRHALATYRKTTGSQQEAAAAPPKSEASEGG